MKKGIATTLLVWIAVAVVAAQSGASGGTATRVPPSTGVGRDPRSGPGAADTAKYRAWVDQYCVSCHSGRSPQPANDPLNLQSASLDDPLKDAATWERVLRKLSVRAMPPAGGPRPQEGEYAAFTSWLADTLDHAWAGRSTPGLQVIHRLNRAEYRNAIRDLLALDVDVTAMLPNDGGDFGFDNIAAALRTSPLLLDGYVTAAQRISTMAIGDPRSVVATAEYSINRNVSQNARVEGLPLGTRGGTVVRQIFLADGEYRLFGRLVRGIEEGYAGIENDQPHTFVITLDGAEMYSAEIGGQSDHDVQAKNMNEARPIIDARMTARVMVTAGPHDVGFTFRERPFQAQDVWQPARRDSQEVHMTGGLPKLKTVGIEGPYKASGVSATASRERVFLCRPKLVAEEQPCAKRIVTSLVRRAYRRPVTTDDVDAPLTFYRQARQDGGDFDAGIRAALARILASPSFLYRVERDPVGARPGTAYPVNDIDLASRLSFFLWSSIPDDRLLMLATTGRLHEPTVLVAEVRRMVKDPRADALVSNFAGQWLQLRNLESKVRPDLLTFPDFDDNIREGFRRETEMLFGYILRQDRSALELLNADYTFVDERLARHYGIPGVYGTRFRQVKVTDDNRRGLLGQGSILSLTSIATRTSPVYRGKYVLTTFLDTPPPPPPPVVPTLEDSTKAAGASPKTVREQLELHRRSPACSGCHRVIDPVGFALENFNPVGQWRQTGDAGAPLDTRGTLADGSAVDSPAALRESILKRPDAFVTVLTTRLMTYALGRGLEPSDMPVVRQIVRQAAREQYRFGALVQGIVESQPFRMRTARGQDGKESGIRTLESASVSQESGFSHAAPWRAAMIVTKKHLSRRTFLRSTLGAGVALPFFDAMVPAFAAAQSAAPFRFGVVYMPCGVYPDTWHPDQAGSNFEFKPVMQPLQPHRDQMVTISKLKAPWGESVHVGASSAFLNGIGPVVERGATGDSYSHLQSKKTLDQFIADHVAGDTPLHSIEVGTEDMGTAAGACDGFPCVLFETLAWRDATSPLPVSINPRVTFERMFGETGTPAQRAARLKEKQSLLDSVTQETAKLRRSLGAPDRALLDEYLSNIRQVEQQLDRMETRLNTLTDNPDSPIGLPEAFDDHMTVTYNLMHLALQGDMSRVFTFMIGHEPTDRSYAHIGCPETHHSISHHGNDAEKLAKYAKIGTYQIGKFAEFVEKLKTTRDGDGTLLDHSLLYWGSGMSNGNLHDRSNPPAVLVGGAHGRLKGNRHLVAGPDEPTANLLLAIAHLADVDIASMGASTGRFDL